MRYQALVCDYDGTIALKGIVDEKTIASLEQVKSTGRRLVLATGRELEDLERVFPALQIFDRVVAENGAILYEPANRERKILAEQPPAEFVEALRQKGITPLSIGEVIVATWKPNETIVLEMIRRLGLELQVTFNKGAVMVLPSGVNKATGLNAAFAQLGISAHNAVGIGDAENDHTFLTLCECSVAVANALPALKDRVDFVTHGDHGDGVRELIGMLVEDDLHQIGGSLTRHSLLLGTNDRNENVECPAYGVSMLLCGTSGSGKSTLATGFLERLIEHEYQYCIIDPEGDYQNVEDAIILGDSNRAPMVEEILSVLEKPKSNCIANLLGIALQHRPRFFDELFSRLLDLRGRTGRPHWIIVDEAHHLLPAQWTPSSTRSASGWKNILFITVHPEHVASSVLSGIDLLLVVGRTPESTVRVFSTALKQTRPRVEDRPLGPGEALGWWRAGNSEPFRFKSIPPRMERKRHIRKYATGDLGPEKSFYFRGPDQKLNLRAQNLELFLQVAEGIDDETWLYHLNHGDYSRWLRHDIKDDELADEVERVEQISNIPPQKSRLLIREKIQARYSGMS
jgi:HAD superfamily hydrolase (TIGR01484 family)